MNPFKKLLHSKKAAGGVVVALISMMVMLLVGIIVVNSLVNSQTQHGPFPPTQLGQAYNPTFGLRLAWLQLASS
jgi:hypothetical protein